MWQLSNREGFVTWHLGLVLVYGVHPLIPRQLIFLLLLVAVVVAPDMVAEVALAD
jgi:hypothetical protein